METILESPKAPFLTAWPEYEATRSLDALRATEFAVRVSLGLASNLADVETFLRLAEDFVED
ncbi:MAG: hypothetical protein ACJ76N_26200 [Thermoanaerobaculia bacterium]